MGAPRVHKTQNGNLVLHLLMKLKHVVLRCICFVYQERAYATKDLKSYLIKGH